MQTEERMKTVDKKKKDYGAAYELPTGAPKYRMTNDFLFKTVLQHNTEALEALLCALLGLGKEQIKSLRILNPIEEGTVIDDKAMLLDLKLELNDDSLINIEMQVENEGNWEERSLTYLCRDFDQLKKGEDYKPVKKRYTLGF